MLNVENQPLLIVATFFPIRFWTGTDTVDWVNFFEEFQSLLGSDEHAN